MSKAPEILKYTESHIQELYDAGRESLYFFQFSLLGDKDLDLELHGQSLCPFLQDIQKGDKGLVCGFRGCLKSSSLRAWLWWAGLYQIYWPDLSSFYVEQKYENAEAHHELFQAKFRYGAQKNLLLHMFRHRLPQDFEGWTKKRTTLVQEDPNSEPFVTVASLDSKMEGGHRRVIIGDDLEGADSDESDVPQKAAKKFVFERSIPLQVAPAESIQIWTGTPHGPEPLVWALKETPGYKKWWVPWVDENGKSRWKARFPQDWVDGMRKQAESNRDIARLVATQYDLKRVVEGHGYFDIDKIRATCYERHFVPVEKAMRHVLRYPVIEMVKEDGEWKFEQKIRQADFGSLRCYMHLDFAHREPDERLSNTGFSGWAIVVVGVSEDWHFHVVDTWIRRDATRDVFFAELFKRYRYWAPVLATYEAVGAQSWFPSVLRLYEQARRVNQQALPTPWRPKSRLKRLPRLSSRIQAASKTNQEKHEYILNNLETPIENGWLHFWEKQEGLLQEAESLGREDGTFDGLDGLAQGPEVWKPHMTRKAKKEMARRALQQEMIARGLYQNPLEVGGVAPYDPMPARDGIHPPS